MVPTGRGEGGWGGVVAAFPEAAGHPQSWGSRDFRNRKQRGVFSEDEKKLMSGCLGKPSAAARFPCLFSRLRITSYFLLRVSSSVASNFCQLPTLLRAPGEQGWAVLYFAVSLLPGTQ